MSAMTAVQSVKHGRVMLYAPSPLFLALLQLLCKSDDVAPRNMWLASRKSKDDDEAVAQIKSGHCCPNYSLGQHVKTVKKT